MGIYRKTAYLVIVLALMPVFASAKILITEVMYDLPGTDTGREWVEIYNSGPTLVTINTGGLNGAWRFSDGLQHALMLAKGEINLPAGSYAVIVNSALKFLADWPNFQGTILDSSFSLNNLWSNLSILSSEDGRVLDRMSYSSSQGARGDGNSLGLEESGKWLVSMPTPGTKNFSSIVTPTSNIVGSSNSNLSSHYGSLPTSPNTPPTTLGVGIGRERIGAVGGPMEFKVDTKLDSSNYNTFSWNFGDGSQGGGTLVSHTYKYPGDYVVILNASFLGKGESVSRVNVKVIDPQLLITFADLSRIEIQNNSAYEVNLFGRALVAGEKYFVFLKDTIIKSGQTLSFGSDVTGLYPQSSHDVFIAVLGDTEQPQFKAKIEEQKLSRISYIKNQIGILQQKLVELFSKQ